MVSAPEKPKPQKNRIRETPEPNGMISRNQAAKKYKIDATLISRWVKGGQVQVAKQPERPGDVMLLDETSLRKRLQEYRPHADNQNRKPRRGPKPAPSSLPQYTPREPSANGHARSEEERDLEKKRQFILEHWGEEGLAKAGLSQEANIQGYLIPAGTPRSRVPDGLPLRLDTKDWHEAYVAASKHKWASSTQTAHRTFAHRFLPAFPALDLTDPVITRKEILKFLAELTDTIRPGKMAATGTKMTYIKKIRSFMKYLRRHGYNTPELDDPGFVDDGQGIPIWPYQTRELLKQCRDSTETDLVYLFAQTGMRVSDIVTIHPDLVHSENGLHYVEVWGKRTGPNPTGYRQVPIPEEAYRRLKRHLETNDELVWYNQHHKAFMRIGGVIEQLSPKTPVDLREPRYNLYPPKTFKAVPVRGAEDRVKDVIERLLKDAGIYRFGMGTHGFRHAYTQEALERGGDQKHINWALGHFKKSEISDRYTHIPIDKLCAHANQYAPRSFFQEDAPQGALPLAGD